MKQKLMKGKNILIHIKMNIIQRIISPYPNNFNYSSIKNSWFIIKIINSQRFI